VTMHDALLGELREDLARGGPRSALASCHSNGAAVSWRVARGERVATGRTRDRLRNPRTSPRPGPPRWSKRTRADSHATSMVSRSISEPRSACYGLSCSNRCAPAAMGRTTRSARRCARSADRYPQDRARGFANGEIRGWCWVEVPKPHGGNPLRARRTHANPSADPGR
jgi:hypothetical protein